MKTIASFCPPQVFGYLRWEQRVQDKDVGWVELSELDREATACDGDESAELVIGLPLGLCEVIVEVDAGDELHVRADLDLKFRAEVHLTKRPAVTLETPVVVVGIAEADAAARDERETVAKFPVAVKPRLAIEGAGFRAGVADEPEEGRHPRRLVFEFDFDLLGVGFVIVKDGLVDIGGLGGEVAPGEAIAEETLELVEAPAPVVDAGHVVAGLEAAEEAVPADLDFIAEDAFVVLDHAVFDLGRTVVDAGLDGRTFDVRLNLEDVVGGRGQRGQGGRGERRSEKL